MPGSSASLRSHSWSIAVRFALAFASALSSTGSAVADGTGEGFGDDGGNAVHAPLAVTAPHENEIAPTTHGFAMLRS